MAFDDVVKSFVGPLSSRVYLTIARDGEQLEVPIVRHNRLTTRHAHAALRALHKRLSALTVCVDSNASAPAGDAERSTGGEEREVSESEVAASEALGLDLSRATNGEWQVTNVHSGGPAADAGLAVGNIVQEADNIGITGNKVFDVVWLLDGPAALECVDLLVLSRYELPVYEAQRR